MYGHQSVIRQICGVQTSVNAWQTDLCRVADLPGCVQSCDTVVAADSYKKRRNQRHAPAAKCAATSYPVSLPSPEDCLVTATLGVFNCKSTRWLLSRSQAKPPRLQRVTRLRSG